MLLPDMTFIGTVSQQAIKPKGTPYQKDGQTLKTVRDAKQLYVTYTATSTGKAGTGTGPTSSWLDCAPHLDVPPGQYTFSANVGTGFGGQGIAFTIIAATPLAKK